MNPATVSMDRCSLPQTGVLALVDIVGLKWLLAGEGVHVHVERLQADPVYARECLAAAARSSNPAARETAARLLARLDWVSGT